MRRWHDELPLMLARWRADERRHCNRTFLDDRSHCLKGPGVFRKHKPLDCGQARCGLCHWSKIHGYRPAREGTRRGRRDRRLEALRHETAAAGGSW